MNLSLKQLLVSSGIIACTLLSSSAFASGYKLIFQNASTFADGGDAAVVEDAATNWYNSAGLVYIPHQVIVGAFDVYAPSTYRGSAISHTGGAAISGKASAHSNAILPLMNYAYPINDSMAFGLSVVPAWGFTEDFGENSVVRYDLTKITSKSIDVAPSLAWKMSPAWSFGVGADFNYLGIHSGNHIFTPAGDGRTAFDANQWKMGGHFGVLYNYQDTTRIGLNYRSKMAMNLKGQSKLSLPGAYAVGSGQSHQFSIRVNIPPTTTLSVFHKLNEQWNVMGSLIYDQWSVSHEYRAQGYWDGTGHYVRVNQPQDMRNTLDVAVGAHYLWSDQLTLKGSLRYEPTPTVDKNRSVAFPDGDKYGINVGARYQINKSCAFDLAYGHAFVRRVQINSSSQKTGERLSGHTNTSLDMLGAQIVWNI